MEEFIVISHLNGAFVHVEAQFSKIEDAEAYARLAKLGDKGNTEYLVYCLHGGVRKPEV